MSGINSNINSTHLNSKIDNQTSTNPVIGINNKNQNSNDAFQTTDSFNPNLKRKVFNDNIFFIGLNDTAPLEINALKKSTQSDLKIVANTSSYEIKIQGKNIRTDGGAIDGIALLKLPEEKAQKLDEFMSNYFLDRLASNSADFTLNDKKALLTTREEFKKKIDDLGLTPDLSKEIYKELSEKTGALITDAKGEKYNLIFTEDLDKFLKNLSLDPDKTEKLKKVLSDSSALSRDELAQVVMNFADGEKGKTISSRIIISSHSDGSNFFGNAEKGFPGSLSVSDFTKVAEILPKGASQIEDISISACNAGHMSHAEKYKSVFPNLKTFMGYAGSAPGSVSGAAPHMKAWEKVTRGRSENISPETFKNFRKGENVATWTEAKGYQMDSKKQIEKNLPEFIHSTGYRIDDYLEKDKPVTDTQHSEMRDIYSDVQLVLGNTPNLSIGEKAKLEQYKNQSLRLLFFDNVTKNFTKTYAPQIDTGYKSLGMKSVDFSKLSRAQCRVEKEKVYTKFEELKTEAQNVYDAKAKAGATPVELQQIKSGYDAKIKSALELDNLLGDGLMKLSPKLIPESWV